MSPQVEARALVRAVRAEVRRDGTPSSREAARRRREARRTVNLAHRRGRA